MKNFRLILTLFSLFIMCGMRAQSTVESADSISGTDSLKNEKELSELVVNAERKYVKTTGRGIRVSFLGNPVTKLGSAADAIKQLPMIDSSKGGMDVLGHGTPLVYINNRRVRNSSELNMLSAENIKDVEIITNPSSRYGSDVTSVILIRTRKLNEGFHGLASANGSMSEVFSASGTVSANYHTEGGITVFEDISYGTSGYRQERYYAERFYLPLNPDEIFHTETHSKARSRSQSLSADCGMNYDFGKHSAGVKYSYYRVPASRYNDIANTESDALDPIMTLSSSTRLWSQNSMHHVNMFGDFSLPFEMGMRFDADYVNSKKRSSSSVDETESSEWIRNENETTGNLWSGKIVATRKFSKLEIEVGIDLSHTNNDQTFNSVASENSSFLQPGRDNVRQDLFGVFTGFEWSPNSRWNVYGGLRWESTDSKYWHDNILNQDLSRSYGNLLPNFGLTFNSIVGATLYYRSSVYRPGYQSLDNNYIYVTPTLWETGNPELHTTEIHRVGLNLSYKRFILQTSFNINERNVSAVYYYDTEKGIGVTKPVNLPRYNSFQAVMVQQLKFGLWNPTLQGVFYIQDLRYGSPVRKYNKPLYTLSLNNRFDIPGGVYAYFNIFGMGTGNQDVVYSHGSWQISLMLNKSWKNWTFTLSANDLLGTWRQPFDTFTNTIEYSSNRNGGSRSFSLSIRYTLNSAKGRYKGKTSRQDEIDRL